MLWGSQSHYRLRIRLELVLVPPLPRWKCTVSRGQCVQGGIRSGQHRRCLPATVRSPCFVQRHMLLLPGCSAWTAASMHSLPSSCVGLACWTMGIMLLLMPAAACGRTLPGGAACGWWPTCTACE